MSFYRKSTPVSQKDRVCQWCGELIPAGERHVYIAGMTAEDEFGAYRMHTECQDAAGTVPSGEEWYPFDQVRGKYEER